MCRLIFKSETVSASVNFPFRLHFLLFWKFHVSLHRCASSVWGFHGVNGIWFVSKQQNFRFPSYLCGSQIGFSSNRYRQLVLSPSFGLLHKCVLFHDSLFAFHCSIHFISIGNPDPKNINIIYDLAGCVNKRILENVFFFLSRIMWVASSTETFIIRSTAYSKYFSIWMHFRFVQFWDKYSF